MSYNECENLRPPEAESLILRILREGETSLLDACREAGLRGRLPNVAVLMREARAGRLEALKISGRWRTSAAAVCRWLTRKQPRRDRGIGTDPVAPSNGTAIGREAGPDAGGRG